MSMQFTGWLPPLEQAPPAKIAKLELNYAIWSDCFWKHKMDGDNILRHKVVCHEILCPKGRSFSWDHFKVLGSFIYMNYVCPISTQNARLSTSCQKVVIIDNCRVVRVVTVTVPFLTTLRAKKLSLWQPKSCQWVVTETVPFLTTLEAKVVTQGCQSCQGISGLSWRQPEIGCHNDNFSDNSDNFDNHRWQPWLPGLLKKAPSQWQPSDNFWVVKVVT